MTKKERSVMIKLVLDPLLASMEPIAKSAEYSHALKPKVIKDFQSMSQLFIDAQGRLQNLGRGRSVRKINNILLLKKSPFKKSIFSMDIFGNVYFGGQTRSLDQIMSAIKELKDIEETYHSKNKSLPLSFNSEHRHFHSLVENMRTEMVNAYKLLKDIQEAIL